MGLFNFFKRKDKPAEPEPSDILLAMPVFMNHERYRLNDVIESLRDFWKLEVSEVDGDDEAAAFKIDGETIALANMPMPIPGNDIEGTAKYAYNWPTALKELEGHTGHA